MIFIRRQGDNREMKNPSGYRVPDITDYILSDAGAGHDYFFTSHPGPPEDSPLRYYCHRACLMMAGGAGPEEAASLLGFPDYPLFRRQFREYTGITPERFCKWIHKRQTTRK